MTHTYEELMALPLTSIAFSFRRKEDAARCAEGIKTRFPELSQSITIMRPLRSAGYYVRIAIKGWSGDIETLRSYCKRESTYKALLLDG